MHIDTIQCLYHFRQVLKHCDNPLWELERHLHVVLPIANDTEAKLPKLKVQTRAIWATLDIALDYQVVQSAVRRHQDRQRYARQSARAHAFFKHMNGKTASLEEESLPPEFSRKMKSSLITTGRFSSRHQWTKYRPMKVLNGSFVLKSKDLAEG